MDASVLAAVITAIGSIVAAFVTGVTTLVVEQIKNGTISSTSRWKWLKRLGYPAAVLSVILATVWVGYLFSDNTEKRLAAALPDLPDHKGNYNLDIVAAT